MMKTFTSNLETNYQIVKFHCMKKKLAKVNIVNGLQINITKTIIIPVI